jgi:ElaA protein
MADSRSTAAGAAAPSPLPTATPDRAPAARDAAPPPPARRPTPEALRWQWSRFDALTPADLYAALVLRQRVFILEQACVFVDADGADGRAFHLLGWQADPRGAGRESLVAYLRLVDPGVKFAEPSIGRVVTAPEARGRGHGRTLMREGLAASARQYPGQAVRIAAQQRLEGFYASLGFVTVSAPYTEDGIPHLDMLRAG